MIANFFLAILCVFTMIASAHHFKIRDGDEYLKISHHNATDDDRHELRVKMRLNQTLSTLETATVICFYTGSNYTLTEGAKGFGFQTWCSIANCSSNTHLGASFLGSTLRYRHPPTWRMGGNDVSHTNTGVGRERDGTRPDFVYNMNSTELESSNFPVEDKEAYLKCFSNCKGEFYKTNLVGDVEITKDWNEHEINWLNHTSSELKFEFE